MRTVVLHTRTVGLVRVELVHVVINDSRRYDVRRGAANNLRASKLAASSNTPTRSFLPPSCVYTYLPTTTIISTGTSFPPIYLSAAAIQSYSRLHLSTLTAAILAAPTTTYTAHGNTCAPYSLLHHLHL